MSHTYTLKNIKIAEFASEETWCFEASLYEDGKRVALADNIGQGGPNSYSFVDPADEARLGAYLHDWAYDQYVESMKTWAPDRTVSAREDYEDNGEHIDSLVNELLSQYDLIKQAKSFASSTAKKHNIDKARIHVFLLPEDKLSLGVEGDATYDKLVADPTAVEIAKNPTLTI